MNNVINWTEAKRIMFKRIKRPISQKVFAWSHGSKSRFLFQFFATFQVRHWTQTLLISPMVSQSQQLGLPLAQILRQIGSGLKF